MLEAEVYSNQNHVGSYKGQGACYHLLTVNSYRLCKQLQKPPIKPVPMVLDENGQPLYNPSCAVRTPRTLHRRTRRRPWACRLPYAGELSMPETASCFFCHIKWFLVERMTTTLTVNQEPLQCFYQINETTEQTLATNWIV